MQLTQAQFHNVLDLLNEIVNAASRLELAERVCAEGSVSFDVEFTGELPTLGLSFYNVPPASHTTSDVEKTESNHRKRCMNDQLLSDAKTKLYLAIQNYHNTVATLYNKNPMPAVYKDVLKNLCIVGTNIKIVDTDHANTETYSLIMGLPVLSVITQLNQDAETSFSLANNRSHLCSQSHIHFPRVPKSDTEYYLNAVLNAIDTMLIQIGAAHAPFVASYARGFFSKQTTDYCNQNIESGESDAMYVPQLLNMCISKYLPYNL